MPGNPACAPAHGPHKIHRKGGVVVQRSLHPPARGKTPVRIRPPRPPVPASPSRRLRQPGRRARERRPAGRQRQAQEAVEDPWVEPDLAVHPRLPSRRPYAIPSSRSRSQSARRISVRGSAASASRPALSGETCGCAGSPPYWSQYQAMCAAVWKWSRPYVVTDPEPIEASSGGYASSCPAASPGARSAVTAARLPPLESPATTTRPGSQPSASASARAHSSTRRASSQAAGQGCSGASR